MKDLGWNQLSERQWERLGEGHLGLRSFFIYCSKLFHWFSGLFYELRSDKLDLPHRLLKCWCQLIYIYKYFQAIRSRSNRRGNDTDDVDNDGERWVARERRARVEERRGSNKVTFHVIASVTLTSVSSLGLPTAVSYRLVYRPMLLWR